MESVRGALRDLRKAFVFTRFFYSFVNALIIFLAGALIMALLKKQWAYAFMPAGIYLAVMIYKIIMSTRFKDIEEAVPELRWQLRTINDNINVDNEVVRSLKENTLKKVREVRTSEFIDNRVTVLKLFLVFGLSFALVIASGIGNFINLRGILPDGVADKLTGKHRAIDEINYEGDLEKKYEKNIYGKQSVIALGQEELALEVKPEDGKADLQNQQDPSGQTFDQRGVLKDIGAAPDKSNDQEKFNKKDSELIKEYLKKLNEYSNTHR